MWRQRRASALAFIACLALLALAGCGPRAAILPSPPYTPNPAPGPVGPPKYQLYVPPDLPKLAPARVLVALHGFGGNGPDFAKPFMSIAQAHGWILVGVGSDDTNAADIPRQWDPVLGRTRVARAQAFEKALTLLRVPVQFTMFPGAKHQLTPPMAATVDAFFAKL